MFKWSHGGVGWDIKAVVKKCFPQNGAVLANGVSLHLWRSYPALAGSTTGGIRPSLMCDTGPRHLDPAQGCSRRAGEEGAGGARPRRGPALGQWGTLQGMRALVFSLCGRGASCEDAQSLPGSGSPVLLTGVWGAQG